MADASHTVLKWISDQYRWHLAGRCSGVWYFVTKPFRIKRRILGKRNVILNQASKIARLAVRIRGDDNVVEAAAQARLGRVVVDVRGNGNRILIDGEAFLERASFYIVGDHCSIVIGRRTYVAGGVFVAAESNTNISLGDSCMLANDVVIRTGDSHGIFDRTSRARLNPGADVRIGTKVWLAHRVTVLKGVTIPDGCIVGTGAIVTKTLDAPHAVYGGHPARKLRDNVAWGWGLEGCD
ncbi:MAG: acyltransferase [Verrucomicrobia bacterium]|nr:acyltransferase [Verrucomicrobiota bacterium]